MKPFHKQTFIDDFFDPDLEKYCRILFKELVRIQLETQKIPKEITNPSRHLTPLSFWLFSKLPKLISDSLYRTRSSRNGMSCMDLIQCLSIFLESNFDDQTKMVFDLLDTNKDGRIDARECKIFAKHCIDLTNRNFQDIEQILLDVSSKIEKLFRDVPSKRLFLSDFQKRVSQSRDNLFQFVFNFIKRRLKVLEKVADFARGTKRVGTESTLSSSHSSPDRKCTKLNEQDLEEIKEIQGESEGIMYRALKGCSLKSYYYKLINDQLFAFKKDSPSDIKTMVYVGHSSYLLPFIPKIQTASNEPLYGIELVSGKKSTQYYIIQHEAYQAWKVSLCRSMGLSGVLVDDYEVVGKIGEGKFGKVLKGIDRISQKEVAIKAVQKSKLTDQEWILLLEEVEIQKQCIHPNLVKFLGKYEDKDYVYIVMEFVQGSTLRKYMKENPKSQSIVARGIVHQVAMALYFLKQLGVIHRDVKPDNILLTGATLTQYDTKTGQKYQIPQVKLTDYGLSTTVLPSEKVMLFCGSRNYTAPQIFTSKPYSFQVDIYSLGVVFYELITGMIPFQKKDYDQFVKSVLYREPCLHYPNDVKLPLHISILLKQMLAKDPKTRIDVQDLLKSRYLLQNQPLLLKKRLSASKTSLYSVMTVQ